MASATKAKAASRASRAARGFERRPMSQGVDIRSGGDAAPMATVAPLGTRYAVRSLTRLAMICTRAPGSIGFGTWIWKPAARVRAASSSEADALRAIAGRVFAQLSDMALKWRMRS